MDEEDGYFGERVAATYDDPSAEMFQAGVVDAAAEVLAELAGGGRALELGIGTGRIALPLARRGVPGSALSRPCSTARAGACQIAIAVFRRRKPRLP
jgi:ubiquinone/menaquinone biosynthesis C-methylase UbiE